jgi:hypothetical protein
MKIIVTGSRAWPEPQAVYDALNAAYREHGPFTLVHGDCSTGADFLGCTEQRYPASWEAYGKAAGPMRNRHMVADGADLVLAFPLPSGSGTHHTIWLAEQAGIPVVRHDKQDA